MSRRPSKTILIVDDHDAVRALIHHLLRNAFPACTFVVAGSGEQAQALAASENPDLIVMDITMPGIDGIEATRRIKATHPGVKVVVLSAHDEPEYVVEAAKAGACGYVQKMAAREQLVPLLKKLLDEPARRWSLLRAAWVRRWIPGQITPDQPTARSR